MNVLKFSWKLIGVHTVLLDFVINIGRKLITVVVNYLKICEVTDEHRSDEEEMEL